MLFTMPHSYTHVMFHIGCLAAQAISVSLVLSAEWDTTGWLTWYAFIRCPVLFALSLMHLSDLTRVIVVYLAYPSLMSSAKCVRALRTWYWLHMASLWVSTLLTNTFHWYLAPFVVAWAGDVVSVVDCAVGAAVVVAVV